jgi:hypothetical protein
MKNTPGKPQESEASPKNRTQEASREMSTPNVTPQPPKGGGKQQKNSNEHIALVLQEAAIKLTRKLTDEEGAIAWKFAIAADHEIAADEVLAAINEPIPPRPGNGKKKGGKFDVTSDRLIRDVGETLGRELTPAEQGTIQGGLNDLRGDTLTTKESYRETVRHYAAEFKAEAEEAAEEARIAEEEKNPPVERWTTQATELGSRMSSMLVAAEARIGTFKAMSSSVDQVRQNFADLKDAIDAGRLPTTARIMPTYSWKKKTKDGKHTTNQKGFLDFQDYCLEVLKRGKSAVYAMLKSAKAPKEPKEPDNSLGAVIKRGAKSFTSLHKKLSDKDKQETTFDRFMEQVVTAARAVMAAELATMRVEADEQQEPATTVTTAKQQNTDGFLLPLSPVRTPIYVIKPEVKPGTPEAQRLHEKIGVGKGDKSVLIEYEGVVNEIKNLVTDTVPEEFVAEVKYAATMRTESDQKAMDDHTIAHQKAGEQQQREQENLPPSQGEAG